MSAAAMNFVVFLGATQLARRIPFEKPDVLNYARAGYVASQGQIIVLAVYYYVSLSIKNTNDQTVLKYVEPPAAMGKEPGQLVTITYHDYNLGETSNLVRSSLPPPLYETAHGNRHDGRHALLLQIHPTPLRPRLMGVKNLYDSKPVNIYVFGQAATGELKRPFKAVSMFGAAAGGPATDAVVIAEAEKRVGKEEEE